MIHGKLNNIRNRLLLKTTCDIGTPVNSIWKIRTPHPNLDPQRAYIFIRYIYTPFLFEWRPLVLEIRVTVVGQGPGRYPSGSSLNSGNKQNTLKYWYSRVVKI